WATHEPLAREAGVPAATIEGIRAGTAPAALSADEALICALWAILFDDGRVSDALYDRAVAALGEAGLIDVICAVGYYSTLAMSMNVGCTALPEGLQPAGFTAQ